MNDKRWCLMVNMTEELQAMLSKMSARFGVRNPKNNLTASTNVAEMIRIIMYLCLKKNNIPCSTFVEIPFGFRAYFDAVYDGKFENGESYIDTDNKIQVRVTEQFHGSIMKLCTKLNGAAYGDIVRSMAVSIYGRIFTEGGDNE